MNLNVLERYVSLCTALSIKPSWKGLNEYYAHNKVAHKLKCKGIQYGNKDDFRNYNN